MKKYILGAVFAFSILVSPAFTQAQAVTGLTGAQIQSILGLLSSFGASADVIANVNAVLGGTPTTGGGGGGGQFCYNFNSDLTVGNSGADVAALRQALSLASIAPTTLNDTSSFNEDTAAYAVQFQAKYGIRQTGYVGPITRAKLNSLYGCGIINQSPIISGVSGPQTLAVNQTGTWSVSAYDVIGDRGNLSYSVFWGDEMTMGAESASPQFQQNTSQNATFTHSYSQAGNYMPKFTVRNYSGQFTQTSLSVNVGDTTTNSSITVTSPNGGETWTKGTKQTIRWQDTTPTGTCTTSSVSSGVTSTCTDYARSYDINLTTYSSPCPAGAYCAQTVPAIYKIGKAYSVNYYDWTVGAIEGLYDALIGEGSYTIQVCQSGTSICDSSDSYFKIVNGNTQPLSITTTSLPGGFAGAPYSASISATGGDSDYNWSATGLPAGLNLIASTVACSLVAGGTCPINRNPAYISGTPAVTTPGTYTVTVTLTSGAQSVSKQFNLVIGLVSNVPLSITTTSLPGGTDRSSYNASLSATGGIGSYIWSATGLPTGLSINAAGIISGMPISAGTYTVIVNLISVTARASKQFSLVVSAASTACVSPANLKPTGTIAATTGKVTLSWDPVPGAILYDVRLEDGTTSRYADTRFTTCESSPHYYCENYIGATQITDVPVTAGKTYVFWVDPVYSPSRAYCNGSTTFTVASGQTASALNALNEAVSNNSVPQTQPNFVYIWNRDLQIGSPYSEDVIALQKALTLQGMYTGEITGGFYNQTFVAVKAFQQKYGIDATGYVGAITRAKLNTLY